MCECRDTGMVFQDVVHAWPVIQAVVTIPDAAGGHPEQYAFAERGWTDPNTFVQACHTGSTG